MYRNFFVLLLMLVLSGCASAPGNTVANPAAHPQFRRFASMLIAYQEIVCADCKGNDWKIGIIRSEKINAASAGGGIFYVTEGALSQLSDDELDAIIAHEVAHEIAEHNSKRQLASTAVTGAFMVLGAFVPGAGYLNHIVNPLVTRAYSREQELEADSIAAALIEGRHGSVARAGHLNAFLGRLAAAKRAKGEDGGGGLFDTHPHPEERSEQLTKIVAGAQKAVAIPLYTRSMTNQAAQEAAAAQQESGAKPRW